MSKLTLVVLAVCVFTLSIRCFAASLDDTEPQMKEETEDMEMGDELDRSFSAHAQAQAQARVISQPGINQRMVDCFVCTDCPEVLLNTTTKLCPPSNDRSKHNKCIIYSEKYRHMKKPWFIRGCASERGSCADIRRAHEQHEHIVKLASCIECEGDRCNVNGVSRSLPDLMTSFVVLIITPILGKYTLS